MSINVLYGFIATVFTWLVSAAGAGSVIFFKKQNDYIMNLMLGFSGGIMIAASFWSLLEPAFEAFSHAETKGVFAVTLSFIAGAAFMIITDFFAEKICSKKEKSDKLSKILLLVVSITLHNIPEGLAVGVAFGSIGSTGGETLMGAISIALGIGIQNFPEGAAVSLPIRSSGVSRAKAFLIGQASALVEPLFGFLGALWVVSVKSILPFALAFAAGAMIMVATNELIPDCKNNEKAGEYSGVISIIAGFAVMMFLDVILS